MTAFYDVPTAKRDAVRLKIKIERERRQRRKERLHAAQQQQTADNEILQHPVRWMESNYYIPELEGPIELAPYQKAVLREALRQDENGRFVYNIILWSDIKKSAKSSIAAAVALHRAHSVKWGSVRIVANDLKQANSRVNMYLRRSVELNPRMSNIRQSGYSMMLPNRTVIEAVPIDPAGEAGGNDDLIIFSELWAAKHKAIQQMWTEMTLSPLKFGFSQRWIETYAGYSGESPVLEPLYYRGVEQGERLDLSYTDDNGRYHDLVDLEVYANGGLLCLWNNRPRLPWQTAAYYEAESADLVPQEFERVHRNKWASSTSQFVPASWWDDCEGLLPDFTRRTPTVLALDASVSGDCFAVIAAVNRKSNSFIRAAQSWAPPENGKIDYLGTVERPGPERFVVKYCARHNVKELRYDPYQLHDMATRLAAGVPVDRNGEIVERSKSVRIIKINCIEFKQGAARLIADKQFFDKIRELRIVHDGDEDLAKHVKNANQKTADGNRLRIVKRSLPLKIDLAVASSMATYSKDPEKSKAPAILGQGKARNKISRR